MRRVVAIDPGKSTGLADYDGETMELQETSFWGAYTYVLHCDPKAVSVVIEVSTDTHVWHKKGKGNPAVAARTGQHVGGVRREGELLAEGLSRCGYSVRTVPPAGKVDAEVFEAVTGHQGRTNQHKRDAAMMALAEYKRLKVAIIEPDEAGSLT